MLDDSIHLARAPDLIPSGIYTIPEISSVGKHGEGTAGRRVFPTKSATRISRAWRARR